MKRLAAALCLALVAHAFASDSRVGLVSFRRIVIPDDVPAHLCSALAQDGDGFLWIGTQGGLVRYDGYRFRTWNGATIGGSYVRALLAARDGRIWIGFFSGGLSVLDPASGSITRYRHDDRDAATLSNDHVEGLAEDPSGKIWVASNGGLDRLDPRTRRFEHFLGDVARGLLVDRAGGLWVGTRAGLQRWRGKGFERVAPDLVTRLYEDRRGRIWIGTAERGAAVFDPANGSLRRFPPQTEDPKGLSHFWVYGIAEGAEGEVWIATFGGGIDVVDASSLEIVDRLRHDATLESTIPADRIGAILRDRSGVIWAGSWGEGIARHDPSTRAFRALRFSPSIADGLTHPSVVRALEMRDGRIWAGTNGNGIDIFDRDLRRVDAFRPDVRDPSALADGAVTCLAQAPDGDVLVATLDGTLHRMRSGSRSFERLSAAGGPVRTIAFDRGAVWAGSAFGLARIDPVTRRTTVYSHDPKNATSISGMAVEAIAVAPDGKLWLGTDNGLNLFDPTTGRAVVIAGLPDKWVPDLAYDRKGRLWVGTHGGAAVLRSFNGATARFDVVAAKIGRPLPPAEELIEDRDGKMWIGPRLRVDPERWTAEEFGPADGSAFRSIFIASRAITGDGRLLFGSPDGLLVVDPAALRRWTFAPRVVASAPPSTRLMPGARDFRMEFAALDLTAPDRIVYRYKLEGRDRDWTTADATQRSLAYTGLAPGSYLLRVVGTNRAGVWSPHELRIPITAEPAFFETLPFRLLVAAAAATLIYLAYRLRVRQLRARSAALERVVAERTSELRVAYARIEDASLTDALTGLRNRRYLEQTIEPDLAMAERQGGDLIFLLVDLDHFKSVNDTYGHAAGDAVLVQIAELLRVTFRTSDAIVRWGGEEFVVVARFVDRSEGPELAEKLRLAVESHRFALPDGTQLAKTCSIGVACWPAGAMSWEAVLAAADAALYTAKESGRNRWMVSECGGKAAALKAVASPPYSERSA
jgi:diguanylate cyclase (GGDEF)-like protein